MRYKHRQGASLPLHAQFQEVPLIAVFLTCKSARRLSGNEVTAVSEGVGLR
jgi:hypothetical protein